VKDMCKVIHHDEYTDKNKTKNDAMKYVLTRNHSAFTSFLPSFLIMQMIAALVFITFQPSIYR